MPPFLVKTLSSILGSCTGDKMPSRLLLANVLFLTVGLSIQSTVPCCIRISNGDAGDSAIFLGSNCNVLSGKGWTDVATATTNHRVLAFGGFIPTKRNALFDNQWEDFPVSLV